MSYYQMDHAGWAADNNRADNRLNRNRKNYRPKPETLTDFQAKVMDILGMVCGGIYNAPVSWDKVDWQCGNGMVVILRDHGFATWDFSRLTQLVFLCHEARIRCDVGAQSHGHFRLMFHPRSHEGGMAQRHPSLYEAVTSFRELLPSDHRIIYRAEPAEMAA